MALDLTKYKEEQLILDIGSSRMDPVQDKKSPFSLFPSRKKRLSNKVKEEFYLQLSMLLSSEIDVREAMQLIVEESKNNNLKKIFSKVYMRLSQDGNYFSHALLESGYFTPFEYHLLEIGEKTGKLREIAESLSKFYSNRVKQKRQLSSILMYPLIILVSTFGLLFVMLKFIVPTYSKILNGFDAELPLITKAIMSFSDLMSSVMPLILLFVLLIVIVAFISRRKNWYRKLAAKLILKIPYIGPLVQKQHLSRFCYSLGFLINANVELPEALKLVKRTTQYYPIESSMDTVMNDIRSGKQLSVSLKPFSIYDKKLISLISMSEGVKRVGFVLEKVSDKYEKEIEYQSNMIGTILQPLLIVLVGGLVTVLALGIFLPMFQIAKVNI